MRRIIYLIIGLFVWISCDRYPDPLATTLDSYSFFFANLMSNKYIQGEWAGDSIEFFVINNKLAEQDPIKVVFEVVSGGGELTITTGYTNNQGFLSTRWKLGTSSFQQKLRAKTYDLSDKLLTTTNLSLYAYKNDGWDPFTTYPDAGISSIVADTLNKATYMISNSTLYRQGATYSTWNQISDPQLIGPRTLNMDKNGIIYISTWGGELLKSTDHGLSWNRCTMPYPDRPYFFYITVSNDNYVWAYYFDHKTRYSKDGGSTWTDLPSGTGLTAAGFGNIFRLKDGSLLYHGSNCCEMNRSFDNGLTWTKIVTPGYSIKLFVNEKDEIFIMTQENGITIYKSDDYGKSYSALFSASPTFGTSDNDNIFNKLGSYYYILIPGFGIVRTSDLTNAAAYQVYYNNPDITNLFIDNNGVLIARTLSTNTVFYHKSTGN
jgi:hypothetical protein